MWTRDKKVRKEDYDTNNLGKERRVEARGAQTLVYCVLSVSDIFQGPQRLK